MRKRFVISEKNGSFIAAVYAERMHIEHAHRNSFNGAATANFYIGEHLVASAELHRCNVADSGGVVQEIGGWWLQTEIGGPGERERSAR